MSDGQTRQTWRAEAGPGGTTILWFDSPGRPLNVLDAAAFDELDALLEAIERDADARGVVIRSAKPAGFCAGADLRTILRSASAADLDRYLERGREVLDRLAGLKVPSVAVVHGVCLGGGLELALACRTRAAFASPVSLQIGTPEVQFGLVPAWGGVTRLCRLLAPRDALGLLLTGNPIGFLKARSHGLVDRLLSQEEPERIAEVLDHEPRDMPPLEPALWESELAFAAAKVEEQPAEFPEVQQAIMDLVRLDVAEGPEAAADAAVARCAELGSLDITKHAIEVFFQRRHARA